MIENSKYVILKVSTYIVPGRDIHYIGKHRNLFIHYIGKHLTLNFGEPQELL